MAEENKVLDLIVLAGALAGAGILIWLLWPKPKKKGFIIREISWQPESPLVGEEISVIVIGKNTTEKADCYCKITNLDTQKVFYDHSIVDKDELYPFTYITTMPLELKLRIETGKIIEGEQEISDFREITIKSPPKMQITSLNVYEVPA